MIGIEIALITVNVMMSGITCTHREAVNYRNDWRITASRFYIVEKEVQKIWRLEIKCRVATPVTCAVVRQKRYQLLRINHTKRGESDVCT